MIRTQEDVFESSKAVKNGYVTKSTAVRLFRDAVKMMINDVINNSAQVEIPIQGSRAFVGIKTIDKDEFKERYANGEFKDIDYNMTDYKTYEIVLREDGFADEYKIRLDKSTNKRFKRKINEGFPYC